MIVYDSSKNVIDRIVSAYKLRTVKSLADMWGITASVVSSRIQRNTLPADYVLRCHMDTGANPTWLINGSGQSGIDGVEKVIKQIALPDDILDKLERLDNLKDKGSLTDDEFNILKANLINYKD